MLEVDKRKPLTSQEQQFVENINKRNELNDASMPDFVEGSQYDISNPGQVFYQVSLLHLMIILEAPKLLCQCQQDQP